MKISKSSQWMKVVAITALLTAVCGCQVRLISAYDPQTDAAATNLQRKLESFLLEMMYLSQSNVPEDVAARSYEANREFYRDVQVDVSSMLMRARAIPQNQRTIEQIELLSASVDALRQLHIAGGEQGLRPAVAEPARMGINTHLAAIIKLELAKMRGSE